MKYHVALNHFNYFIFEPRLNSLNVVYVRGITNMTHNFTKSEKVNVL